MRRETTHDLVKWD
jgi:hypothetical protein